MSLAAGSRLGPYEILSSLGSGGMGEVYRARDSRLDRDVAIKILPPHLAADPGAVARFEQEGRAVAALSHPNILAIHDVGHQDGVAYVVTELLDGETLRDRLATGRLSLRKAIDYAMHVAQGLAAAHGKGITHRDIKPENLFVTADAVKILDFGLAKVQAATEETRTANLPTDPGTVLGTAGYLSPEQAQGRTADHRSDIFSLGAVLYEMATGLRAFKGDSAIDSLHKVIHSEPTPIDTAAPDAPAELRWVLTKCLAKDPDERYQSTRDLVVDLKSVMRALDSSPRMNALTPPTAALPKRGLPITTVAAVLLVAAAVAGILWWRGDVGETVDMTATGGPTIERVTSLGTVINAVISPDGKYVVYVVSENARQSLWLRQIATASTLELVPPASVGYWGANFSPDGSEIYYVMVSPDQPDRGLFRIATLGGSSKRLLTGIDSVPVFSPDGREIAYMRGAFPEPGASSLMVAGIDGSNPRALATRRVPESFVPIFFTAPAWSPDGATIVCPMISRAQTPAVASLVAVRAADGTEDVRFPRYEWADIGQPAWAPDGQGLYVVGSEVSVGPRSSQLWWISATEPRRRRITNDLMDYRTVSLSADASMMMAVAADTASAVWTMPLEAGEAKRLPGGGYDGLSGLAAAPGGRILFRSVEAGPASIWTMNGDGSARRQITFDKPTSFPAVTPDGQSMVFQRQDEGLWLSDLDGQNARVIPNTGAGTRPEVSRDGKSVLYTVLTTGIEQLWQAPLDGSAPPTQVLGARAWRAVMSPDGTQVAFYYQDTPKSPYVLAVMPVGGDRPTLTFEVAPSIAYADLQWTVDGKALLHNSNVDDRANIWLQPLSGGPPRQVTRFADQVIFGFDRSLEGEHLIIARGMLSRDAVIIRNFK